jgi:hypothetical protein
VKSDADRGGIGRNELVLREGAGHALAFVEEATRLLAEAETLDDVKAVREKAETARIYAKAVHAGLEVQNRVAELKLRAERTAGEFLASLALRGGNRRSKAHDEPLKLAELGITRNQSTRWQKEAAVPEQLFCQFVKEAKESGREITAAALIRLTARSTTRRGPSRGRSAGRNGQHDNNDESLRFPPTLLGELVAELRHHQSALAEILGRFINVAGQPTENDRRLVQYLLGELARVIEELAEATV